MDKRFDRDRLVGVVGGDVLEDLGRCEGCSVLHHRVRNIFWGTPTWSFGHLIVSDQPDTRRLIVLIICDHHIISTDLKQISFRRLDTAAKVCQSL